MEQRCDLRRNRIFDTAGSTLLCPQRTDSGRAPASMPLRIAQPTAIRLSGDKARTRRRQPMSLIAPKTSTSSICSPFLISKVEGAVYNGCLSLAPSFAPDAGHSSRALPPPGSGHRRVTMPDVVVFQRQTTRNRIRHPQCAWFGASLLVTRRRTRALCGSTLRTACRQGGQARRTSLLDTSPTVWLDRELVSSPRRRHEMVRRCPAG